MAVEICHFIHFRGDFINFTRHGPSLNQFRLEKNFAYAHNLPKGTFWVVRLNNFENFFLGHPNGQTQNSMKLLTHLHGLGYLKSQVSKYVKKMGVLLFTMVVEMMKMSQNGDESVTRKCYAISNKFSKKLNNKAN